MITVIDTMTEVTGWTASGGASIHGINEHPEYCADNQPASMVFAFSGGAVSKTFSPIDVEGHDEIVMTVWSRNLGRASHRSAGDFSYKITINSSADWYLPVHRTFHTITIPVEDVYEVTSVEIEALSGAADYLIVSALYAVKDEYPLDVMSGVVRALEVARGSMYPDGLIVNDVYTTAGSKEVEIGLDTPYVDRYSVVRISDADHAEYHQIAERNGSVIRFTGNYDGKAVLHDYDPGSLSLWIPIVYGVHEAEAVVPGISVYVLAPEPQLTTSEMGSVIDGYALDGSARVRRELMGLEYPVLMSCESRSELVGAMQGRIVRWAIGQNTVWINGRAHDVEFNQAPVATEPQGTDVIGIVQYTVDVSVREERARRVIRQGSVSASLDIEVRRN
jgi:hypothetical protein